MFAANAILLPSGLMSAVSISVIFLSFSPNGRIETESFETTFDFGEGCANADATATAVIRRQIVIKAKTRTLGGLVLERRLRSHP